MGAAGGSAVTGTLLNVATVVVGGTAGTLLGSRLPEKVQTTLVNGIGLMTLLIGVQMALQAHSVVLVLVSLLLGGVIGCLLGVADRLDALGAALQRRLAGLGGKVSEAFVTTSLIFCVGPLTILGSIQDGLQGRIDLLTVKSALDGITALAFASTLGPGVLLSAGTILLYQGGLTLGAGFVRSTLTDEMIGAMTAVGGLMIVGLGLEILRLRELRVANYLPALVIAPLAVALQSALQGGARP